LDIGAEYRSPARIGAAGHRAVRNRPAIGEAAHVRGEALIFATGHVASVQALEERRAFGVCDAHVHGGLAVGVEALLAGRQRHEHAARFGADRRRAMGKKRAVRNTIGVHGPAGLIAHRIAQHAFGGALGE